MRFVPVPGFGIPTHDIPILDPDRNLAAWLDRGINAFTPAHPPHRPPLQPHPRPRRPPQHPPRHRHHAPRRSHRPLAPQSQFRRSNRRRSSPAAQCRSPHCLSHSAIAPAQCLVGLFLAGLVSLAARPPLEPLVPHQQEPLDQLLRPLRRRLARSSPSPLLLAHRHPPPQRDQGREVAHLPLARLRLQRHRRLRRLRVPRREPDLDQSPRLPRTQRHNPSPPGSGPTTTSSPSTAPPTITSLAFAIAFVAVCFIPNWLLWRKRIFLKI